MGDEAYRKSVTTIQVKKETKEYLHIVTAHSGETGYEALLTKQIIPMLQKKAGSEDPVVVGKWLSQHRQKTPPVPPK
jgi:hypothetical protein